MDWSAMILRHIACIVDPGEGPHQLAYGNLLTHVFRAFQVPLGAGKALNKKDMIVHHTALECKCAPSAIAATAPTLLKSSGTIT